MDLELWQLAVSIGDDPVSRGEFLAKQPEELAAAYLAGGLPPQAQSGVRGFLARYGHRAVAEIDLGMPRWSEEPDHILGMISNYLRVEDPEQAPDRQFARAAEHAEDRIRSLVERARARSPWRARALELSLRRVRQLAGLRELPKFYIVLVLGEMHRQLLQIGARLAPPALSRPPTTSSSWTSTRSASACAARTCTASSRTAAGCTTRNYDAGASRGCCCPTAPTSRPP